MSINNNKRKRKTGKFSTLKKNIEWNNINSEKSYNKITSKKKNRVIMHHCSSCGYRIRHNFSLNSNMNIKIKKTSKNKNKRGGGKDDNKAKDKVTHFEFTIKGKRITFGYDVEDDSKFNFYREGFEDENNNVSKMINIGIIRFKVHDTVVFISWLTISSGKMAFHEDGSFNIEKSIRYGNRGYGTAMLAAFEKYILETYKNVNELQLVVEYYSGNPNEKNPLNFFYEKSGFTQMTESESYYHKKIRY